MVERLQSLIAGHGIPILNAVLVAVWLVGTTIALTIQWTTVKHSIESTSADALIRDEKISTRLDSIERSNISRWTRDNQELWCLKTEQKNANWECGDFPSFPYEWWMRPPHGTIKPTEIPPKKD